MKIRFKNCQKLVIKCMIIFQVFIKFSSSERITKNTMSHLYFNEKSDYSEENTCENEVFLSTILHHRRKLNYSRLSCRCITYKCQKGALKKFSKFTGKHLCQRFFFNKVASLRQLFLQNNLGRLLLKCGHCKNEARKIDCLRCRDMNAMFIASAKIPERGGIMSPSGICPTICHTSQPYLPRR